MLLDDFLPEFDIRSTHSIRIAAPPERVYASLRMTNFDRWGIFRGLAALRMLPAFVAAPRDTWRKLGRGPVTLDRIFEQGFSVLGERTGTELVMGTIGRFWQVRAELWPTSPATFREPAPEGMAKGAWNFVVDASANGSTELTTETRVLCVDVAARRRFLTYWTVIRPFSGLIRMEMLAAIRATAEAPDRGQPWRSLSESGS